MKFIHYLFVLVFLLVSVTAKSQYNPLWIPDTLSGTTFNLIERDTFKQILPGQQTIVGAINGQPIWGPTMFWNKGDSIQLHVTNQLLDTTTLHWHGIHLPAIMDGGPHQVVPPNTTWNPTFRVKNNAATYWYHPHLHMMTHKQLNMGLGGLIIVRDPAESTLNLPRRYGIDDIPLVLTDRRFDASNQFVLSNYGDTMMANFTLNAQVNLPAQVVRIRILNTAAERFYNVGFSDNRNFSIIASDGGLLSAPVSATKRTIAPGERIEILVNLSAATVGTSLDLRAYNNSLQADYPGYQPTNYFDPLIRNDLGGREFNILHINIVARTASPVLTVPSTLVTSTFPDSTASVITRTIVMSNGGTSCPPSTPGCFLLNSTPYNANRIDYRPVINTTEIWQITNTSNIAHPFHIHDAQFKILTVNGNVPGAADRGWKDVVVVRKNFPVRFVVAFPDYADSLHPFMYHCHMAPHEDAGMMGQFTVMPLCVPTVNSFVPNPLGAGSLATITGLHLNNISQVKFNGSSASFTVYSDSMVTATVPSPVSQGLMVMSNNCGTATVPYNVITSASITTKLFLQGLYTGSGMMQPAVNGYADSISVRLYTLDNYNTPAITVAAMLQVNGTAVCNIPVAYLGRKLWICIRHRNSLETWSKLPVMITDGMVYDFTH